MRFEVEFQGCPICLEAGSDNLTTSFAVIDTKGEFEPDRHHSEEFSTNMAAFLNERWEEDRR